MKGSFSLFARSRQIDLSATGREGFPDVVKPGNPGAERSPGGRTKMELEHLWNQLREEATTVSYMFLRPQIKLHVDTFNRYEAHFKKQFALFSPYENLRSVGWWKHLHAIKKDEHVYIHFDRGNPNSSLLLNIPHAILDVAPYLFWCLINFKLPFRL